MYVQMCAIHEGQSVEEREGERKEDYVLHVNGSAFFMYMYEK